MVTIHYVFWDSDNTLVETAEHHWRKHVEILKTHGIKLNEKYRQKIYENNGVQNYQWISKELGLTIEQDVYLNEIDTWYFDHIDELKIRDGVLDAIKYFNDNNIIQAVVSNGRKKSVMAALKAKDLERHFKFILCKEDYEGRKPSPEPYNTALFRMETLMNEKINPINCLVIEDDPLGVEAGNAAGMSVLHRPIGDNKPIKMLIS